MISNPNSEIRMSKEVRIPKSETAAGRPVPVKVSWVHSGFAVPLDFELRVSAFGLL